MKHIKIGIKITIFFAIVCGIIYPLVLTGIGQVAANKQANGSLIYVDGKPIGSKYIGQSFNNDPKYFHGRPSSINYNMTLEKTDNVPKSGGAVLAPDSKKLQEQVKEEIKQFLKQNPEVQAKDLPAELFTDSASGLDPDISLRGAEVQIDRVSKNTGISKDKLNQFIKESEISDSPSGTTLVNVLELNLNVAKEAKLIK